MALTNYERQKRWREKNRLIYNSRRRNARKNLGVGLNAGIGVLIVTPAPPTQTSKEATLARLRGLVKQEEEKPSTDACTKPDVVGEVYRNDSGGVISKFAWDKLQKMKEKAKEGGYTLDEYSQ